MGNYLLCIAIDAAAPVIVGIVRPGFIFVICCRIFAFADGACARIPAAHAGTGFRLGVAGIALAGAGVGFVSIGQSNRSSRDPVRPLSDRICNRSGCRYRRSSSPFPCRWGLSPRHDAPDRGCPDQYRRFQKCSASGSRSRNRLCNTRPEIHRWPRTSDTCRRAVPRTNGEFCSPLYYSSYRRASACRDCSTRGRQTCGLPCIFRGTRRTQPVSPQLTPEQSLVSVWLWTQKRVWVPSPLERLNIHSCLFGSALPYSP